MKPLNTLVGKRRLRRLLFLLDFLWITLSIHFAQTWRTGHFDPSLQPGALAMLLWLIVISLPLWTMTARKLSLDHLQEFSSLAAIVSRVATGVAVLIPLAMGLAFLARNMYSRLFFLYLGVLLFVGFSGIRFLLRKAVLRFRSYFVLRTVIIGAGRVACEIASKITASPELLRDLVAFVHPANRERPHFAPAQMAKSVTALSSVSVLDLLVEHSVGEVIVAGSELNTPSLNQLIAHCREHQIEVCVLPHLYDLYSSQARIMDLAGLPLVKVESRAPAKWHLALKRLIDLVMVFPLLILAFPAAFSIAMYQVVRRRHVLDSELRCGIGGRRFKMYRFGIPRHACGVAGIDAMLDRVSLTELPQLVNVLRSDMSIVGPRPEDPSRVQNYSDWQRQRLLMPPGITGLAQVHGLRDKNSSDEKCRYDLQYIHNWSPLLDVSLVLQTASTLTSRIIDSRHPRRQLETLRLTVPPSDSISLGDADVNRAQSGAD
ncbi:MAG: sugar transferase [Terriglobales bacterium]